MPAAILLLGADEARFILNITAILSCGSIAIQQWNYANKQEWKRIIVIMLSGMVVGTALYHIIPLTFLLPVYGVIIIAVDSAESIADCLCHSTAGAVRVFR